MTVQQGSSDPSAIALFDLIVCHRITAIVYVAVRLGVTDCLAEGAKTSRHLAHETNAHEPSLQRLLRALVTIGVCKRVGKEQFALTAMGGHLAGSAEQSLKAWALFEGELLSRSWGGLLDSIRTGKTAAQLVGIDNSFDLMAQNPASAQLFDEGMVALTRQVIPAVLAAYDFSSIARLIDVGGRLWRAAVRDPQGLSVGSRGHLRYAALCRGCKKAIERRGPQ